MEDSRRRRAAVWGLWGLAILLACPLSSCARKESASPPNQAAPFRLTDEGQLDAHVGGLVEVEGIAVDSFNGFGPRVTTSSNQSAFLLNDLSEWPRDVVGKRVLVTGRVARNYSVVKGGGPQPPSRVLVETRWKVLEPSAIEDGVAPVKLTNRGQFGAYLGKRVEVEGTADDYKVGPYVTTPFYSFQLNDLSCWPTGVGGGMYPGKKVLVTGRLVRNPGLSYIEVPGETPHQEAPHPPFFALDEVRWKAVDQK